MLYIFASFRGFPNTFMENSEMYHQVLLNWLLF